MVYVLIRDGDGLAIIPRDRFLTARDGGETADVAVVLLTGECDDCLAAIDAHNGTEVTA